ncbi:hypothetical protein BDN72DRAFT_934748 [Pluteus cervinus]|uniref:Uncharacterized protein n=1 Tax=Pluteus cervinus TaxID=181527 RepID=A0ACD3A7Q6_9AGAR|nr:hypothetical protein BDN72DRAFT_934748 [Pluteus cervinus]
MTQYCTAYTSDNSDFDRHNPLEIESTSSKAQGITTAEPAPRQVAASLIMPSTGDPCDRTAFDALVQRFDMLDKKTARKFKRVGRRIDELEETTETLTQQVQTLRLGAAIVRPLAARAFLDKIRAEITLKYYERDARVRSMNADEKADPNHPVTRELVRRMGNELHRQMLTLSRLLPTAQKLPQYVSLGEDALSLVFGYYHRGFNPSRTLAQRRKDLNAIAHQEDTSDLLEYIFSPETLPEETAMLQCLYQCYYSCNPLQAASERGLLEEY